MPQQHAEIAAYCAKWGLTLRHKFSDVAESGGSTVGRDDFNYMVDFYETKSNRPTGLLLWNYARFARDIDDSQLNKIVIRRWGVVIHSLNDQVPEGRPGRIMEFLIDVGNEEKREQISRDTKRGLRDLVEQFGCIPGAVPRGFRKERVQTHADRDGNPRYGHRWVIDPDMAPKVLRAFEMRAAGASLGEIHKALKLYGSISSYATFWSNKIYYGRLEFGDDYVNDHYCEPIVPKELWDQVQVIQNHQMRYKKLKTPGSMFHPRRTNSSFLLSGLVKCGRCDSPCWGHNETRRSGNVYQSYYCSRAFNKRDCVKHRISAEKLDAQVISKMTEILEKPENLMALQATLKKNTAGQYDAQQRQVKDIGRELSVVRRSKNNLTDAIENMEEQDPEKRKLKARTLIDRIAQLELDEAALIQKQATVELSGLVPLPEVKPAQLKKVLTDFRTILAHGSLQEKQTLLRGIINEIHVHREDDGDHVSLNYFYFPDTSPKVRGPDGVRTLRHPSGPPLYTHTVFFVIKNRSR